jgi:transcriptional regulator with XRE-family HTH domain
MPTASIAYRQGMVTIDQIRAARGLLDWSQTTLAQAANIPLSAVKSLERGRDVRHSTFAAIEQALSAAGILFQEPGDTRDGGYGLRFRK